jgi:hypothetical protein
MIKINFHLPNNSINGALPAVPRRGDSLFICGLKYDILEVVFTANSDTVDLYLQVHTPLV